MKTVILCILTLLVLTAAAFGIGYGPTSAKWGADGIRSMTAIAVICLGAAVIAFAPLAVVSRYKPSYFGQAALASSVLRLFLTLGAGGIYQYFSKPHMPSFLFWALVFYGLMLVVETTFAVVLVSRHYRPTMTRQGASA